ncbi:trypsin-like peptidase domain-containing protein [Phocaeicola coprocola]
MALLKTGIFVNGQLTGKGTARDENGNSYEGDFLNYRMHGNGILRWGNGSTFAGYMVNDAPYTGKFTSYTGDVTYIQKGQPVERITETKSGYSPKIGQQVREYFDENWNRCAPKQAAYYRLITYSAPNKPKDIVKDYYISGELQSEQYPIFIDYDDEGKTFLEGIQKFYHKNGSVSGVKYYYNNLPNGPQTEYYPDGKVESESFWVMGVPNGDMIQYYPDGNFATVAKYENGKLHNNKYLHIAEDQMVFLVYNEDFERNRETWEFQGQPGIVQVNDAESISIQANPERQVSGGIYTGFAPMSDNIISVLTNQRNPGQGIVTLLFGYKDWDNLCAFSIAGDQYSFTYKKNGVVVQNDDWKKSPAIKPDVNKLTIVNNGNKITMYVNDEPLVQTGRIYYDGSLCGISLYNGSEMPIVIDAAQLTVQEVLDPRNIAQEYLPEDKSSSDGWKGNGSGFFLNPKGYIATNYHVVEGTTALQANFTRNGKTESYPATVVVTDPQNDLAIIKIDEKSFDGNSALPYGLMTRTKDTGSEVFAMGYPMADVMGSEVKFTDGKISSKSGIGGDVRVYQISVPIQPGNSGGPLFDMGGNVVGITSSGLNRDYFKSENVNYAIKASYLKNLMEACPEEIILEERVETPVSSATLTDRIKQYEGYVVLILTK